MFCVSLLQIPRGLMYFGHICLEVLVFVGVVSFVAAQVWHSSFLWNFTETWFLQNTCDLGVGLRWRRVSIPSRLRTSNQILGMPLPKISPTTLPLGASLGLSPYSFLLPTICISQGRLNAVTSNPSILVALRKCVSYLCHSPDGYLEGSCLQWYKNQIIFL